MGLHTPKTSKAMQLPPWMPEMCYRPPGREQLNLECSFITWQLTGPVGLLSLLRHSNVIECEEVIPLSTGPDLVIRQKGS